MDYDPNQLGGLGALLGGFQQKVQDMKEKAAAARCEGVAGGGLVRVVLTGDYQVDTIEIGEGALEDRELLEDLVRAAVGEALRKVQDEMKQNMAGLTGGLPLPPGLLPF